MSSLNDQRLTELYYFDSTIMHVLHSCVQVICRYSMSPAISHHINTYWYVFMNTVYV